SAWAGYLGTTKAGTSIYNIKTQVNKRLTGWKNRVNGYVVKSIKGWNDTTWRARFRETIVKKRALIVLHPKLNSGNSDYVPRGKSTGGHFNVGAGYLENGKVLIFEPYSFGGSVQAKMVWDRVGQVAKANQNNTSQRNIAY
ncbi:hypothetical protein, partial [Bowdeniella nasicola]|uniref:hypothetical protein n=1 Tax=Bowdeniella nasicola TaxID=208480 RepID=UPI00130182CD